MIPFLEIRKHWRTILFLIFVLFISFFKLGDLLLFDVDEAVNAEAAREMVETGNVLSPTYNYEPRYDKPIFIYWVMSVSFKLFGITEFSARLVSALFGAGLVMMTFLFVRRLYGERPGVLTGLCLLLNIEYFVYSHAAITDMLLTFFITAALFSFYLGCRDTSNSGRWYMFFWASAALATLTKGVIGFLFPLMIGGVYSFLTGNIRTFKSLFNIKAILVFVIIAIPWYAAQFYIHGWDFFNAFIVKHHFQRFTGVVSSHSGPFYYYLVVLVVGFFPWIAFLPRGIYRGFKEKDLYLYGAVWVLAIGAFFSISRTKLPNYILPVFPGMAILSGLVISDLLENTISRSWRWVSSTILFIISLIFASFFFLLATGHITPEIQFNAGLFWGLGLISIIVAAAGLFLIKGEASLIPVGGLVASSVAMILFLSSFAGPKVNEYLQGALYRYAVYAKENLRGHDVLATYEINQPSIVFYSTRKIVRLEGENGLKKLADMAKSDNILLITKAQHIKDLQEKYGMTLLETDERYGLLSNARSFSR